MEDGRNRVWLSPVKQYLHIPLQVKFALSLETLPASSYRIYHNKNAHPEASGQCLA